MKKLVPLLLLACLFLVTPLLSEARGLVPCGGEGEPECQSCHVVTLTNGVIEWLVLILGTIAAIIIVYAGVKLVTSGGNQAAMEKAKSMMTNIIIGYIIVLGGWLVIDYIMKAIVDEGDFGVWNAIECVEQPVADENEWTGGVISDPCTMELSGSSLCTAQESACTRGGGTPTVDTTVTPNVVRCLYPAGGSRPPDLSAGGACSASLIEPYFPTNVGNAQCIIRAESACGASSVSRTDVMSADGRAFSFGAMQINLTVHVLSGCAGFPAVLDCKSAFSGRNYSARVINEALYQQCARAAQNPSCNIRNGARIYREAGNRWRPWSTAAGCGLR